MSNWPLFSVIKSSCSRGPRENGHRQSGNRHCLASIVFRLFWTWKVRRAPQISAHLGPAGKICSNIAMDDGWACGNTISEACAGILVGTTAGPNSICSNTFFNARNAVLTADRCTPPLMAPRQANISSVAKAPRLSPARPSDGGNFISGTPVPVLWVPPVVKARTASLAYAMPGSGRRQSRRESFRTHTPCTSTHPVVARAL